MSHLPGRCAGCGERVWWFAEAWRESPTGDARTATHVCSVARGIVVENESGARVALTTGHQATPASPEVTVRDDTRPASGR